MGIVIIGLFALYLLISIVVIVVTTRIAKKKGGNARLWGGGAALVMYLLVFWDHIPTVIAHKYYCETEAGFWVYKTVDQWKAENPGVIGGVNSSNGGMLQHTGDRNNFISTEQINHRLNYVFKHNGPLLINRWKLESQLLDIKSGEVLAKYVDFSTSQERRQAGWSGWKFWLDNRRCSSKSHNDNGSIQKMIMELGGNKK